MLSLVAKMQASLHTKGQLSRQHQLGVDLTPTWHDLPGVTGPTGQGPSLEGTPNT